MAAAPSLSPLLSFLESRAKKLRNWAFAKSRNVSRTLSSIGGNGPPTTMNAPDRESGRDAGLSFIPIQKNPMFSIKRNVTVF
jgi:hypothetical protein